MLCSDRENRRLKRKEDEKRMQEESWGKERCLVEQQLLGLLFNKSRHMHAVLRAPLQSRPKGNAVQSPITQHHSQPTTPGDPTPGTSYHNARPPDLPPGLPCLQANRMCVCLGVLLHLLSAYACVYLVHAESVLSCYMSQCCDSTS